MSKSETQNKCSISGCTRPAESSFICRYCADNFKADLDELYKWMLDDLQLVVTKQTKYATQNGSRASNMTPLIFNVEASNMQSKLRNQLHQLYSVALIQKGSNTTNEINLTANGEQQTKIILKYLIKEIEAIRLSNQAAPIIEDITYTKTQINRIIDRPPSSWYIGKCNTEIVGKKQLCQQEIYANTNQGIVTCKTCKTQHDIEQRRKHLFQTATEMFVTASEAAAAIRYWTDIEVGTTKQLINRIIKWAERGRLTERGHVLERGISRPIYKLGDILELVTQQITKKSVTNGNKSR